MFVGLVVGAIFGAAAYINNNLVNSNKSLSFSSIADLINLFTAKKETETETEKKI